MPLSKLQVLMIVNDTKSGLAWSLVGTVSVLPTVTSELIHPTSQYITFVVHLLNARGIYLYLYVAQKKEGHGYNGGEQHCLF